MKMCSSRWPDGSYAVTAWVILLGVAFAPASVLGQKTPDALVVRSSRTTGSAVFVTAADGGAIAVRAAAAGQPQPSDFLAQHGHLFGVTDPAVQLAQEQSVRDAIGQTHTDYRQVHQGVPVFSGRLKVHQDVAGRFVAANGRFYPVPEKLSTVPALNMADAVRAAMDALNTGSPAVEKAELVIVDPAWYGDPPAGARLAWHVVLNGTPDPLREGFFIDAFSGGVLDRWSMIHNAKARKVYDLNGTSQPPTTPARQEGDPPATTGHADINRGYDYAGDVYDYFFRAFGRDSIDGAGMELKINVNYYATGKCPNAYWDGQQMVFCAGLVTDDIMAHELTHGVTQHTANLIYQNQPGQLNESFSDVFGELVDLFNGNCGTAGSPDATVPWPAHPTGPGADTPNNLRTACSKKTNYVDGYRWLMGEDAEGMGAIRDMWTPTCFNDPDRANSPYQTCSPYDNGGVHSGSGVPNHAFALTVDGGTFNGQTITGIGPIKAGAIWYRVLTTYLYVTSDFKESYYAFKQAGQDLIGTKPKDPRTGLDSALAITAADVQQLDKALKACEMDTDGRCGSVADVLNPAPPPACDVTTDIYSDDFETTAAGWTVSHSGSMTTPYDWVLTTGSLPYGRTGKVWFCNNLDNSCDGQNETGVHYLQSPPIVVPDWVNHGRVAFTHWVGLETGWDGGNVKIRANGGDWQLVPAAAFAYNPYNSTISSDSGNSNPKKGEVAWTGRSGVWGTSVISLETLITPGQTIEIRFEMGKDSCMGYKGWYIDDFKVYNCSSPPKVTSVSGASGAYVLGQTVSIQVQFDQLVDVIASGGTPKLAVNTGVANRQASYVSGTGTNVLSFDYAVQAGDNASDLDYTTTGALTGTIRAKGQTLAAILTLPAPGSAGSLAGTSNIIVRGAATLVPPVLAKEPLETDGTTNTIAWQPINGAGMYHVQCAADSLFAQIVTQNRMVQQTSFTFAGLDYNRQYWYRVSAWNGETGEFSNWSVVETSTQREHVAPRVVAVRSTTPDGVYGVGRQIDIQVLFDQAVKVDTAGGSPVLAMETGADDREAVYLSGSGSTTLAFRYTVQAGDMSADLDCRDSLALSLAGSAITTAGDWGGDAILALPLPGDAGSLSEASDIEIDTTPVLLPPVLVPLPQKTSGTERRIEWSAAFGADAYLVQCGVDGEFTSIREESGWITQTSFSFIGLKIGETYWYRAKSRTADGTESQWSRSVVSQQAPANQRPQATAAGVEAVVGDRLAIQLVAADPDKSPASLTYAIVAPPAKGDLADFDAQKGSLTYTARAGETGQDSFTFKVSDGEEDSDPAVVTIEIRQTPPPPPPPPSGGGGGGSPSPTRYTLAASVPGGHGTVEPAAGLYDAGTVVMLKATTADGYRVKAWNGTADDTVTDAANTVRMDANRTVTVEFEMVSLTASAAAAPASIVSGEAAALAGSAAGGLEPYVFAWSPATGLSAVNVAATDARPTETTTYTLTVTDALGQVASSGVTVTVSKPEAPKEIVPEQPQIDDGAGAPVPANGLCGAGVAEAGLMTMLLASMALRRRV